MDVLEVPVTVEYKDGSEDEINVNINIDDFAEKETASKKVDYITKQKISPTSSRSEGGGDLRFSRGSSPD